MPPEQIQPEPAEQPVIQEVEATQPPVEAPAEASEDVPAAPEVAFSWQASEFVHHHKSMLWYAMLAMAVIVLAAVAVWLQLWLEIGVFIAAGAAVAVWLQLWLEIGVFIAAGAAVVVYAKKPPRTLLYELSNEGVHVDGHIYTFDRFRSFSVVPEEEWHSIDLESSKRFNPRLVLLFNTPDLDEIVGHLELHLPREDRDPDLIERITRYVRF